MTTHTTLKLHARTLALSGLLQSLDMRLQEAQSHNLPHAQFLELLLQDEIHIREQRQILRRTKAAAFRSHTRLQDFDFTFNPAIPRARIHELAACHFIRQKRDALLIGPPGVGKTHLAQALGAEAIRAGFHVLYRSIFDLVGDTTSSATPPLDPTRLQRLLLKPDLLIIDDMGLKTLPARSGEILLEIIMRRHENRSTLMTSNRPVEEWGQLLGDIPAASAILDRLLHRSEIIAITGPSYRLHQSTAHHLAATAAAVYASATPASIGASAAATIPPTSPA
jgi:DNA replication protein DnaC